MTKSEQKKVLAMMRTVIKITEATEKTAFSVQKERYESLRDGFRSLGFDSDSASNFISVLNEKHIKKW